MRRNIQKQAADSAYGSALMLNWLAEDKQIAPPRSVFASDLVDALSNPSVQQRFAEMVVEIPPPEQQIPEALGAFHEAEIKKWWPIIKSANIKPE